LDDDGYLDVTIAPNARAAQVWFDDSDDAIELLLGQLDPPSTNTGVQSRLTNLGFSCGEVDGIIGPLTSAALRAFQESVGIEPTGTITEATRKLLAQAHGS
jgi:peptidoglycan hydrolase-like protein with peptidoglycan-binding domain